MGLGSSRLFSNGTRYQQKALDDSKVADEILKLFFELADVKDLINLTSVEACPAYVITTAKALKRYFTEMNLYPSLGEDGKIVYAPISDLAPGLFKDKNGKKTKEELEREIKERNKICIDLGYYWVRIFQIYSALALTVLEGSPLRSAPLERIAANKKSVQAAAANSFKKGPLTGDKSSSSLSFWPFKGGAIAERGIYKTLADELKESNFEPLLSILTPVKYQDEFRQDRYILNFDDKRSALKEGKFSIKWQKQRRNNSVTQTLDATYVKGGFIRDTQITAVRSEEQGIKYVDITIDGQLTQRFAFRAQPVNKWFFIYDGQLSISSEEFYRNVYDYFESIVEATASGVLPPGGGTASVGAGAVAAAAGYQPLRAAQALPAAGMARPAGLAVPTGKSIYDGYDQLKQIFEGKLQGKGFPKAYCIARAMTLLNPVFEEEMKVLGRKGYTSSVCEPTLDFELAPYMPRTGSQPKLNIYWKSLVSLFYDEYTWSGNQILFTQSETGRSDLKKVSIQLAYLYGVEKAPENFLESSIPFRPPSICPATGSAKIEIFNENFRTELYVNYVKPMLDFQQQHAKDVNTFLKEMFVVVYTNKKPTDLKFTSSLAGKDKTVVNEFGKKAAQILLNYYKRSEGLYNKGLDFFSNNRDKWRIVGAAAPAGQPK